MLHFSIYMYACAIYTLLRYSEESMRHAETCQSPIMQYGYSLNF